MASRSKDRGASPQKAKLRSRHGKSTPEDASGAEKQTATTSGVSIQASSTNAKSIATRSSSRIRRTTELEEREILNPAWAQFVDDGTFEPTLGNYVLPLAHNISTPLSPLAEEESENVDLSDQHLQPATSSRETAIPSPLRDLLEIEADAISNSLVRSRNGVSQAWHVVAEKTYSTIEKARARLQSSARRVSVPRFDSAMVCTLLLFTVLSVFSWVIAMVWEAGGIDWDRATSSICNIPVVNTTRILSCNRNWTSMKSTMTCSGWQSNSSNQEKPLSDADVIISEYSEPTILESLENHKHTCAEYGHVIFQLIGDDLATSTASKERLAETHDNICWPLQNTPRDLISYYLGVRANVTYVFNHVRDIQNVTQQLLLQLSPKQLAVRTKGIKGVFPQAISLWQRDFASMNASGARMKQKLSELLIDLATLRTDLRSARSKTSIRRSKVIGLYSWPGKFARWIGLSPLEPWETYRYTKAIAVINKWYAETTSLESLLIEVNSDVADLDKLISDLAERRLSFEVPSLFSDAELPELQPFLSWMSEDVRRIHAATQTSKVMKGWRQHPETNEVLEGLRRSSE